MNLVYLLSLPRSGSTLLSAMLDRRKGIISMPESSFPQVLGAVTPKERKDSRWLAALYLGSTMVPTPITFAEAMTCISGSDEEILKALGRLLAVKIGRDPEKLTTILWKTTRTIGMNEGTVATSGKYIVLRRHPLNVFESQFRVDFGLYNRQPWRFALFRQSYENAFAQLPKDRVYELDYERIPEQMPRLLDYLGLKDKGEWEQGVSNFETVAKECYWLNEITGEFRNTDEEKRKRLDRCQKSNLERAMRWTRPIKPLLGPIRSYYDMKSLDHIRLEAKKHINSLS
jgi:hypothetical protein